MIADLGIASEEFYTGTIGSSNSDADSGPVTVCYPDTVTLDGWTYGVDLEEYRFGPLDTFRDGVVANDEPNDSLFNARGAWARYRFSWHHGADQEVGDLDREADNFRFDESFGFDPWTRYRLKMLPKPSFDDSILNPGNDSPVMLRSGGSLYVGDDTVLKRITTSAVSTISAPGGNIQSLATDGSDLYVATSTKLVKLIGGNTSTTAFGTPVTGDCNKVAFVANRLLLGQANVLKEVSAAGALTTISTHFQAGFRWTTIFAIGSRIYVGGFAGIKSELYTLTTDSAGLLVVAQEAAPFPIGEQLLTSLSVGGACLLGSSHGVRFAQVGADGTLTYGPLLEAPGAVHQIASEGKYAWITWNDVDTHMNSERGTARLDLTSFVDVLQPAYAADVSLGVSESGNEVAGVERFDDRTWLLVRDRGVFYARDDGDFEGAVTWVQTASLTAGRLFFGTVEPKGLLELELRFSPLQVGQAVSITVTDENDRLIGTATQALEATTSLSLNLDGEQVIEARIQIDLGSPPLTAPIEIYGWRMRAYPGPPQTLQWLVPMITNEVVVINDGEGEDMAQASRGTIDKIEALHASRRLVTFLEGKRLYRVRVESFEHRPTKWSELGDAPVGICIVQLVSA